jgi:hypothetical protein
MCACPAFVQDRSIKEMVDSSLRYRGLAVKVSPAAHGLLNKQPLSLYLRTDRSMLCLFLSVRAHPHLLLEHARSATCLRILLQNLVLRIPLFQLLSCIPFA